MAEVGGRKEVQHELQQQDVGGAGVVGGLAVRRGRKGNAEHSRLDSGEKVGPDDVDVGLDVGSHRHQAALDAVQHVGSQAALREVRVDESHDVAIELQLSGSKRTNVDEVALFLFVHVRIVVLDDSRQNQVDRVIARDVFVQQLAQLADPTINPTPQTHVRGMGRINGISLLAFLIISARSCFSF